MDVDLGDYERINRANWNSRVVHHERGYGLDAYDDPAHLSGVITFDLPRLGSVDGLRGVHLQCHIGTDTVSLARLGARMTGLDFSGPALEAAARLAARGGQQLDLVESTVDDALTNLPAGEFDFVYTGIGALCWLPSIERWAHTVAALLKPGGFLFIREGHPVVWSLCDPRADQLLVIEFPYFEHAGVVFEDEKTYVEHDGVLDAPTVIGFNHGLAEIFNALWSAGMTITLFEEHRSLPWNPFHEDAVVEDAIGEFSLKDGAERIPLSYTLRAVKN